MKTFASLLLFLGSLAISARKPAAQKTADPFSSLAFLEGTWEAKAQGQGATNGGTYTFRPEFAGHVLARHSTTADCKAPTGFDCEHGDLLYIYPEGPGLKAIYFDNEGHVIHYDASEPDPNAVVFLSDPSIPGPQFRLTYTLQGAVMQGKFQMHMPGAADWRSYLEWSGAKK